jgi:hypothetical protein
MTALVHHLRVVQLALGVLIVALMLLTDRFPGVPWLRRFRLTRGRPPLTDEQKRAIRRRENRRAGVELVFAGLVTLLGAPVLWAMFFREPSATERALALIVIPGALIGLGALAIAKSR